MSTRRERRLGFQSYRPVGPCREGATDDNSSARARGCGVRGFLESCSRVEGGSVILEVLQGGEGPRFGSNMGGRRRGRKMIREKFVNVNLR